MVHRAPALVIGSSDVLFDRAPPQTRIAGELIVGSRAYHKGECGKIITFLSGKDFEDANTGSVPTLPQTRGQFQHSNTATSMYQTPVMSQPLRLEFSGTVYHVSSRGDRREDIYWDEGNRNTWLTVLSLVCERFN